MGPYIIEPFDMHGSHHDDGTTAEEEDSDDNTLPDSDLVVDLFVDVEWAGRKPKFERVMADLKRLVFPRSIHSGLYFPVRLLSIKSHYRISNRAFDALLALLLSVFPRSQLPKSYDETHAHLAMHAM